jgi:hypothetical protein
MPQQQPNSFSLGIASDAQAVIAQIARATGHWHQDAQLGAILVGKVIAGMIPSYTHWQNGTGTLDGSFTVAARPYGAEAGSDLPYSRRREFGFSGRTDSLGRYYANDPGAFYMQAVLQDLPTQINQALSSLASYMGVI